MSRFYVPKESVKGKIITIAGDEAHHILDVMRLKQLDKVITFDGTGSEYIGFIKDTKPRSLTVEIIETRKISSIALAAITLIQAIPKKEKMNYIVEKATELGVHSIIPVTTERTIPVWDEAKKSTQLARWEKIATGASKQCGRSDVPEIVPVQDFKNILKSSNAYDFSLIAALSDESMQLKSALAGFTGKHIAIAIGPEGDFTPGEIAAAKDAGFNLISLGDKVLKSDTAGLAVLAILNYEFSKR